MAQQERTVFTLPGLPVAIGLVAALVAWGYTIHAMAAARDTGYILIPICLIPLTIFLAVGLFIVNPNDAKVLQLFGRYVGTIREPGLHWANPFYLKRTVSVKVRNFESTRLKVNDLEGNPIEIAAVIVWRVVDTAEAVFDVDDYVNYVHVQSEAAVRALASQYPYDAHGTDQHSLRTNAAEVCDQLKHEISQRLTRCGVEVIEARLSHLAYAQEIAQVMLRRQQALAIIAARSLIVQGAVGMVELALEMLDQKKTIHLDEERKAAMVSNLMVVLCVDREAQPVINTGTLYQ